MNCSILDITQNKIQIKVIFITELEAIDLRFTNEMI